MRKNLTLKEAMRGALFLVLLSGATMSNAHTPGLLGYSELMGVAEKHISLVVTEAQNPLLAEAKVKAFLTDFYDKYIFNTKKSSLSFEEAVQKSCTKALQEYLQEQYEYECESGPCYEISCFLTGNQDGESEVSKLLRVESYGGDWYKVVYVEMGTVGTTYVHCVVDNGVLKMDKLTNSSSKVNSSRGFISY